MIPITSTINFSGKMTKNFWLVQVFTIREADFNQFIRLRNQLVIVAKNLGREKKLSPLLIPTMPKDTNDQLKLDHKVVGWLSVSSKQNDWCDFSTGHCRKKKIERSRTISCKEKKRGREVSTICLCYVNYKLENFIYLIYVMNFACDKVNTKNFICNVPWKVNKIS